MSPSLLYTHIFSFPWLFNDSKYFILFQNTTVLCWIWLHETLSWGTIYHPSYLIDPNIFLQWMIILIFKKYISCFHCESKETWTESFIDFGGHWMVYGSTAIRILVSRINLHLVFGISYEKCLRGKNMELFS